MKFQLPEKVFNFVNNEFIQPNNKQYYPNLNPHNNETICEVSMSGKEDVAIALEAAKLSQKNWEETPAVQRGMILFEIAQLMRENADNLAHVVALESGKIFSHAKGEVEAAIQQALFMAGEGQRLYGKITGSNNQYKQALITREAVGVCALIVASNTPIANIAWKTFPSLICGNSVVLKGSEDTPLTAWYFCELIKQSRLPKGVFNVIHGFGPEVGEALVQSSHVDLVSFTGSTRVGKAINQATSNNLVKTFLELGGKNPMIICDDCDMDNAVNWAVASSFSNAGQRCAASSRIIIFDSIYDEFKKRFLAATEKLTLGVEEDKYLGPVINKKSQENILNGIEQAKKDGAEILIGGDAPSGDLAKGCYINPTIIEGASPDSNISQVEYFGPLTCIYKVADLDEAIELANNSDYGLTASIHTKSYHRIQKFSKASQSGVVSVNAGTHGSEPHIPFGGVKHSGAGGREPGTEALDIYTNIKVIFNNYNPELI